MVKVTQAAAITSRLRLPASRTIPDKPTTIRAKMVAGGKFVGGDSLIAVDRAVVITVAWKAVGVELRLSELGTEQLEASGAPVQVSVTFPLKPGPPIIRL